MTVTPNPSPSSRPSAPRNRRNAVRSACIACLALGALALSGCRPAVETNNASQSPTPAPTAPSPVPATPAAPTPAPSPSAAKNGPVLYVPGKDDLLHPHALVDPKDAIKNLNALIELAPLYFPKGTRVLQFSDGDKHATLDLSAPFNDQKFYSRGESIAELAVTSLVNSAATFTANPKNSVQLTVEGKNLSTLGEYDASDPIEPDHKLVAKP